MVSTEQSHADTSAAHVDIELEPDSVSVRLNALHFEINDCLQSISQYEDKTVSVLDDEFQVLLVFLDNIILLDLKPKHVYNTPGLIQSLHQCCELEGNGTTLVTVVEKSKKVLQSCINVLSYIEKDIQCFGM